MYVKKVIICFLLFFLSVPFLPVIVHGEENPLIGGSSTPNRINLGSSYWTTSNLREWLNSNQYSVQYTNQPPNFEKLNSSAYDKEAGFLTGFTEEEQDAIAVTERRSFVSSNDGSITRNGGSTNIPWMNRNSTFPFIHFSSPNIQNNWKASYYQTVNDKVFILSPNEIYEYVQKRGMSLKKELTNDTKQKFNISNRYYQWSSTHSSSDSFREMIFEVTSDGMVHSSTVNVKGGIVPALHVKPNYVFGNGIKASEVNIGDKVTFGKYNGYSIEWVVINKTQEGFPLLWSEKIMTIKVFDAPGDQSKKNSISINFSNPDVSIKDDLNFINPNGDRKEPIIKIVNTDDLESRQNASWTLILEALDEESGVKEFILPDGTKVQENRIEYKITENGIYHFSVVDNAGNYYGTSIPVGNFNPPASVVIDTSANGWTNKDVNVDIFASNADAGYERDYIKQTSRDVAGSLWSNYSSYIGKKVRITGKVKFLHAKKDVRNLSAGIGFTYIRRYKVGNDYHIAQSWPSAIRYPLKELMDGQIREFDITYTIPGDFYEQLKPWMQIDNTPQEQGDYGVEWFDIKYELLDKEDFGIEKIILPSGKEVFSNTYKDTLTEEGVYQYKVYDSRGMTTTKTVEVKIDKDKPNVTIIGNPTDTTHQNVILKVSATDSKSGVKRIQKPNGEWSSSSSLEYSVFQNGTYTFVVEDNAGNQTSRSYTVSNIDKTISLGEPTIEPFPTTVLQDKSNIVSADISSIMVKDWRDGNNKWRIDVSASPLTIVNGSYQLPKGTIQLKPLADIKRIEGNGNLPIKGFTNNQVIDNGKVKLVEGNQSKGKYEFIFPENPLEIVIDPTTAKVGTYKSTITWELVQAP